MHHTIRSLAALAASTVLAIASLYKFAKADQKRLTAHKKLTSDKQAGTSTQDPIFITSNNGNLQADTSAFKTTLRVFLVKIGTWAADPVVAHSTSAFDLASSGDKVQAVQKPANKKGITKMLAKAWHGAQLAATKQALALLKAVGSRPESYNLNLAVGAA